MTGLCVLILMNPIVRIWIPAIVISLIVVATTVTDTNPEVEHLTIVGVGFSLHEPHQYLSPVKRSQANCPSTPF